MGPMAQLTNADMLPDLITIKYTGQTESCKFESC